MLFKRTGFRVGPVGNQFLSLRQCWRWAPQPRVVGYLVHRLDTTLVAAGHVSSQNIIITLSAFVGKYTTSKVQSLNFVLPWQLWQVNNNKDIFIIYLLFIIHLYRNSQKS